MNTESIIVFDPGRACCPACADTSDPTVEGREPFFRREGRDMIFHGRVTACHTLLSTPSVSEKLLRSLLSWEPYQVGPTVSETVFRLQGPDCPRQSRDFRLSGAAPFSPGDEVTVTAQRKGRRWLVTGIRIQEKKTSQEEPISARLIGGMFWILLTLPAAILSMIVSPTPATLLRVVLSFLISMAFPAFAFVLLWLGMFWFLEDKND